MVVRKTFLVLLSCFFFSSNFSICSCDFDLTPLKKKIYQKLELTKDRLYRKVKSLIRTYSESNDSYSCDNLEFRELNKNCLLGKKALFKFVTRKLDINDSLSSKVTFDRTSDFYKIINLDFKCRIINSRFRLLYTLYFWLDLSFGRFKTCNETARRTIAKRSIKYCYSNLVESNQDLFLLRSINF